MRRRICVFLVSGAATVGMVAGPVSGAFGISGLNPLTPGNSKHFKNTVKPCTVSPNQHCPSPKQQ